MNSWTEKLLGPGRRARIITVMSLMAVPLNELTVDSAESFFEVVVSIAFASCFAVLLVLFVCAFRDAWVVMGTWQ